MRTKRRPSLHASPASSGGATARGIITSCGHGRMRRHRGPNSSNYETRSSPHDVADRAGIRRKKVSSGYVRIRESNQKRRSSGDKSVLGSRCRSPVQGGGRFPRKCQGQQRSWEGNPPVYGRYLKGVSSDAYNVKRKPRARTVPNNRKERESGGLPFKIQHYFRRQTSCAKVSLISGNLVGRE